MTGTQTEIGVEDTLGGAGDVIEGWGGMKRWKPIILSAALFLAACATSTEDKIVAACQGYASTLATLATMKDDLSESQISTVEKVRAGVNPICQEGRWTDANQALSAVEDGVTALAAMKGN